MFALTKSDHHVNVFIVPSKLGLHGSSSEQPWSCFALCVIERFNPAAEVAHVGLVARVPYWSRQRPLDAADYAADSWTTPRWRA
jgi:hypothetical protein